MLPYINIRKNPVHHLSLELSQDTDKLIEEQPSNMLALQPGLQRMTVRHLSYLAFSLSQLLNSSSQAHCLFSPLLSTCWNSQAHTRCKALPEELLHHCVGKVV